jgi:hypothetical protein
VEFHRKSSERLPVGRRNISFDYVFQPILRKSQNTKPSFFIHYQSDDCMEYKYLNNQNYNSPPKKEIIINDTTSLSTSFFKDSNL